MSTLIVDDEPIARSVLREELETLPDIKIVGEAENGKEALERIAELHPDLVFLDLQMPILGGLEVVQQLAGGNLPIVVIVTAFDQHAIQAFETGAVDYLLKPVSGVRLQKAVQRATRLRSKPLEIAHEIAKIASTPVYSNPVPSRKIAARSGEEYFLLDPDDILAFQAERELVWIVTPKRRLLATQNLRATNERLTEQQFQRVHRNAIVNLNHVRKMTPMSSQRWILTLSNSLQIMVSKRQARHIRRLLNW